MLFLRCSLVGLLHLQIVLQLIVQLLLRKAGFEARLGFLKRTRKLMLIFIMVLPESVTRPI